MLDSLQVSCYCGAVQRGQRLRCAVRGGGVNCGVGDEESDESGDVVDSGGCHGREYSGTYHVMKYAETGRIGDQRRELRL